MQQAYSAEASARAGQLAHARAYINTLLREGRLEATEAAEQLEVLEWARRTGRSVLVVTDIKRDN
jgi:hypothetical protein